MKDPVFWLDGNIFYDTQRDFPKTRLHRHLMRLVFLRRQEEKLTSTNMVVAAVNGMQKDVQQGLLETLVGVAYPFIDLKAEAEKTKKAMVDELNALSKQAFVFDIPQKARRAPKGIGQHVLDAIAANKKRRGEPPPR